MRRSLLVFPILALFVSGLISSTAYAATVTLGQLAPPSVPKGECTNCTDLQLATAPGSPSYVVPAGSWTLTSWSGQGGIDGGSVALRVFRPTGSPGQFRLFAATPQEGMPAQTVSSFQADIPVESGDLIGLETGSGAGGDYPTTVSSAAGNVMGLVVGAVTTGQTVGVGGEFVVSQEGSSLANISATLTGPSRLLSVAKAGTGTGTVTSSPPGIECGSLCSANFDLGSTVNLSATPSSGSVLREWSGACSGTGGCQVTLNEARSVTATFETVSTTAPGTVPAGLTPAPTCKVPKLTGKSLKASKAKIKGADCKVGKVTKKKGAKAGTGKVVGQSKKPGTVLPAGTVVKVTLGKG